VGGAARATRRQTSLAGARAMVPWLVGLVPYGLVIGVAASRAGIPGAAGWLAAPVVLSGSAQVTFVDLLDAGATTLVVVVATLAVNLRLVLYSATMAPRWRGQPWWWQAIAAYFLVEPSLAVGVDGYERHADRADGHLHYLGGAVVLWIVWVAAVGVGLLAGTHLPPNLRLELVIPLFLTGEIVTRLTSTATRRAAGTAGVVAIVASSAPLHLGPVLAITIGIAVALTSTTERAR